MPESSDLRRKKPVRTVILLLLTGIFLFSGYKALTLYLTGKNEEKAFTELTELVESYKKSASDAPKKTEKPTDDITHDAETAETTPSALSYYEIVYEKNPDFTGWLTVPNTNINYPVMYTPDDPEYYLHIAFDKTYSLSGTPFIGADCDTQSDCFIIYGHNMKNDTMFGTLDYYSNVEFFEKNPEFTFDTLYEERTYCVFAAFKGRIVGKDEYGFRYYDYAGKLDENAFSEFITELENASLYKTGVKPVYGDQILLLSTCAYHTENGRFVVAAYRIH